MTFINIFSFFSEKIRLDVSSESSAGQRIHMKNQALFSSKDKRKKLKSCLLQFLFGALRANTYEPSHDMTKPTVWHVHPAKNSAQPGHPPSLIRVSAVCLKDSLESELAPCQQERL